MGNGLDLQAIAEVKYRQCTLKLATVPTGPSLLSSFFLLSPHPIFWLKPQTPNYSFIFFPRRNSFIGISTWRKKVVVPDISQQVEECRWGSRIIVSRPCSQYRRFKPAGKIISPPLKHFTNPLFKKCRRMFFICLCLLNYHYYK